MIKPKLIIISVCIGFVLSFIIGLIAGVSFGIVMLRALAFAALFGVLCFGVGLIFQRFLLDSGDSDGSGTDASGSSRQGSIVDLSVGDEPLVEDENGPDFYVRQEVSSHKVPESRNVSDGGGALSGNTSSIEEKSTPIASESSSQEQFRPIALGATTENVGGEAAAPNISKGVVGSSEDELPEIGDIAISASDRSDDISSGGMDLAIENGMETRQGRGISGSSTDSYTTAQAIRTVIARDS